MCGTVKNLSTGNEKILIQFFNAVKKYCLYVEFYLDSTTFHGVKIKVNQLLSNSSFLLYL